METSRKFEVVRAKGTATIEMERERVGTANVVPPTADIYFIFVPLSFSDP